MSAPGSTVSAVTAPPATSPRPRRTARTSTWTVVTVVMGVFLALSATIPADERRVSSDLDGALGTVVGLHASLGTALALLLPFALIRRNRAPLQIFLVAAGLSLVFPIGPGIAGLALIHVVRDLPVRTIAWCAGLYAASVAMFLVFDLQGTDQDESFIKMMVWSAEADPATSVVGVDQVAVWAVALFGVPLGIGLYLRERRAGTAHRTLAEQAQRGQTAATQELGRRAERERIAREVHDVIGHRLSLLSLHAGGLEVAADSDPRVRESAALVREHAQVAMADLRSLIEVLRGEEPDADEVNLPSTQGLEDLAMVVDDTVATGVPVVSTVYLRDAERAGITLSRAVFRIVQELLTNARRHANGAPVRLAVHGGPDRGVQIESVNRLLGPAGPPGNGLTGVRERVTLIGGTMESGPDADGAFRVSVHLPWIGREDEHG